MKITVNTNAANALEAAIKDTSRKLRKELAIAVNKTANKVKSLVAKRVGQKVTLAQKSIKKLISLPRKATNAELTAVVGLKKTKRINLKFFKARQTKTGVTTKIFKQGSPQVDRGAFKVQRWKGRVIQREGKARTPLKSLSGPSVAEVFEDVVVDDLEAEAAKELEKQIKERVRFITLKKSGAI